MTLRSLAPLAFAVALLATACGGAGSAGTDGTTPAPSDAIHDFTLGAGLDDAGGIEMGWAKRDFPVGDPIYLAMDVSDAQENAEIEVRWIGPDGKELAHEIKRALPERGVMSWKAPEEVTLSGIGEYQAKVFYQGSEVQDLTFRITGYAGENEPPDDGSNAG